jgi:hypothetical protein
MADLMRQIWYCGFSPETDREVQNKVLFYNIIILVFALTAIPFAVFHVANERYGLASFLIGGTLLLGIIRVYLGISRDHQTAFLATVLVGMPVFLANYVTGGVENNGPLWYFTYPMVAMILVGPIGGSMASIGLMVFSILLLYPPLNEIMMTAYSPKFLFRFFICYVIVSILAFSYEFQKERSRRRIKELSGLLPICARCKKIRDDRGYWSQIEAYIRHHSDAHFSHGICPECADTLYSTEDNPYKN